MGLFTWLLIFTVTTAIAILTGLVVANLFVVGKGITIDLGGLTADESKEMRILNTIIGVIPTNIFASITIKLTYPGICYAHHCESVALCAAQIQFCSS